MITDSEKFKFNLITDLRNPISCISRIRRSMSGPSFLWFWNNKMIIVSELNLKLTFDFDNNISFVEYSDEELNKKDDIFDLSQEAANGSRIFLIESTFFFRNTISFELDKYQLDIENNRLIFRLIGPVPNYTFKYDTMKGVNKNMVGEKLPIYNCQYRESLEDAKTVYCLAYLDEAQQTHLKGMKWPNKATQRQRVCINQIKEKACSPSAKGILWHFYLASKFLKIGSFEE